jgi:hypothetical protein
MRKGLLVFSLILLFTVMLSACSGNSSSSVSPTDVNPTSQSGATVTDGQTLLDTRCTRCHSVAKVANIKADATQWQKVVTDMIKKGAVLSSDEEKVLVQYLAANFK